jgi:tetratricopeptide (TPR) repeat protein
MNRIMTVICHSVLPVILGIGAANALGCTMFKITENGKTVVGNNEDWSDPNTRIWFETGNDNQLGVAYVGFDDLNPQGAINESGLVFDIFAMPQREIIDGRNKKPQPDDFLKYIMRNSSTVEEVKSILESYNLESFDRVMLLYIDKSGKYLIQERDVLTLGENRHYVLSNFSPIEIQDLSQVELPHYQKGRNLLNDRADLDFNYCETVLESLHQAAPGWGGTQYSTLYNLDEGKINLYFFHDYNRSIEFDLQEELEKGNHVLNIPDMFPDGEKGHAYLANYREYNTNLALLNEEKTFLNAVKFSEVARKIKEGPPKKMIYGHYDKINSIGYEWIEKNNYKNAIAVFSINVEVFDWVSSPFGRLANAYLLDGQYEMAIKNYTRVLEISPEDEDARKQLQLISEMRKNEKV